MLRRSRNESGFSLVEAIVAIGVLTTAVAGLVQLLVMSVRSNRAGRDATFATVLAQQKAEELRTGSDAGAAEDFVDSLGNRVTHEAAATHVRQWSVEPSRAYPADLLVVTVVVTPLRSVAGKETRVVTIVPRSPP